MDSYIHQNDKGIRGSIWSLEIRILRLAKRGKGGEVKSVFNNKHMLRGKVDIALMAFSDKGRMEFVQRNQSYSYNILFSKALILFILKIT
jgi:hypothetical protein